MIRGVPIQKFSDGTISIDVTLYGAPVHEDQNLKKNSSLEV
ncbi:hypothetical protein L53_09170 [Hyphomonas sp. L-53-1-40]|nr:hypothetical protein L53_09170 [Hyphomonas sp. L-53-1-40]